jgi:hypothetical protein
MMQDAVAIAAHGNALLNLFQCQRIRSIANKAIDAALWRCLINVVKINDCWMLDAAART